MPSMTITASVARRSAAKNCGVNMLPSRAIGAPELRHLRVEVRAHVLVAHRERLVERSIDAQAARRSRTEQHGPQREQQQDQRAVAEDEPLEVADHSGGKMRGVDFVLHGATPGTGALLP